MKAEHIQNRFLKLRSLAGICLSALINFTSCLDEDLSNCQSEEGLIIKVVLSTQNQQPEPTDISDVKMYIFDKEKCLLEMRSTAIDKLEYLNYPGQDIKIIVFANTGDQLLLTQPATNEHIDKGELSLKKATVFANHDIYHTINDLLWGGLDIPNPVEPGVERIFEIPARRITPGVFIRIYGLDQYAGARGWNNSFAINLVAKYNKIDFYGNVSASETPIRYMPPLGRPTQSDSDIWESPGGNNTNVKFFNIFSTDDGSPVSVDIYSGQDLVHTVSADSNGMPILAQNGQMCIIEIYFHSGGGNEGDITVNVTEAKWGYVPPIVQEFE